MRRVNVLLTAATVLAAVLTLTAATPAVALELEIDPAHSDVGFTVRHMVVSKVRGSFTGVSGTIVLDAEHPERSSVRATIDAATIDTRNEGRDKHLRSKDFFDVEAYPTITFTSRSVRREGQQWLAKGTLEMHGVAKEVEIVFTVAGPINDPWGNRRLGVESAPLTLDRKEFGLTWNKALDGGGVVVGEDVTVTIELEAVARAAENQR